MSQVHIYNTFMLVHMCGTFSQLYLLHMYSVLHIDAYVVFSGSDKQKTRLVRIFLKLPFYDLII